MSKQKPKKPVNFIDPITKRVIVVRSVYVPKGTLLNGGAYSRSPSVLRRGPWGGNK